MRTKIFGLAVFIILIGLSSWSPWLTEATASNLAESQFNHAWAGVVDGCGTAGTDLGIDGFHKVPFGAYVTLTYQCGLVTPDEPPLHTELYVSFMGMAFGYPRP